MFKDMSRIYNEDCVNGMEYLADAYGQFADVVITSPPYAEQRKHQYGGVSEKDYPQWTVDWMRSVKKILSPEGSVFINIRPHIKNGVISDYVLKTRLALREDGWKECEEIIWYKPDSPPLGSINRPRRAWEHVLWFSQTGKPFCDPKANGKESDRIGFENNKFEHGGKSHIHAGQNESKRGTARSTDVIVAGTSRIEQGHNHPAMYPLELPEYLIKLACPENGFVIDPFLGSGTTARASVSLDRGFVGFEINRDFYREAERSLTNLIVDSGKTSQYADHIEVARLPE